MRTIRQLKTAIAAGDTLIWNDPDPIEGNNYIISEVFLDDNDEYFEDTPILIQYGGGSEAEVLVSEIAIFAKNHIAR